MSTSRAPSSVLTVTDQLIAIGHIGSFATRGINTPRYIEINRNEIFNALVELYTLHFKQNSNNLKHLITSFINEECLARVYISHWFLDLYLSIKEACRKHPLAFNLTHFQLELGIQSTTYDYYLVLLLNNFKPTRLNGFRDPSLFIPIITKNPDWTQTATSNYFNITNFCANTPIFNALIDTMTNRSNGWLTDTYSDNILGRPFWLLDFHEDEAFAWFPNKNYDPEDLNLAFILGVSCTPLMALHDDDVPQQYPGNKLPLENEKFDYKRETPEQFFGNVSKRVVEDCYLVLHWDEDIPVDVQDEMRRDAIEEHRKLVELETLRRKEFTLVMYKIMDYRYCCRVIRRIDDVETRMKAHMILTRRC